MADISKDTLYYLESLITDSTGKAVTGLSVTYKVINSSDNSELASGSLIDVGNGVYQGSYLFDTLGQYRILYFTPSGYTDEIETVTVLEGSFGGLVLDKIDRILGLVQENYRIFNPVYDRHGNLLHCTIKTYNSKSDCDSDINPLAVYEMIATHDSKGLMRTYKVTKI